MGILVLTLAQRKAQFSHRKPGTRDPGITIFKERKTGIEERMRKTIIEEGRKLGLPWNIIEEAYYYFLKLHRLKTLNSSIDEE